MIQTESPVSSRRAVQTLLPGLTLARVLAMFMIVAAHSLMSYTWFRDRTLIWPVLEGAGWLPLDAASVPLRNLALPFFFVLAGISAAVSASSTSVKRYFVGRWRFIGWPLLIGLLTVFPLTLTLYRHAMQVTDLEHMSPHQRQLLDSLTHRPYLWGPAHLWFLEFLLIISCGYAVVLWASRKSGVCGRIVEKLRGTTMRAIDSPWRAVIFATPLLAIFLVDLRPWEVLFHKFLPEPATLVYYALFFACGVCIARLPQPRETLARDAWLDLSIAFACYPPLAAMCWHHFQEPLAGWQRVLLLMLIALSVSSTVLAMLGLSVRYVKSVDHVTQYFASTSFWIYFTHVPFVIALQIYLWHFALPIALKFFLVFSGGLAFPLALYELTVRPAWSKKRAKTKSGAANEFRYARAIRRVAGVAIASVALALLGYGYWLMSHDNLHQLAGRDVYRSARLSTAKLEELIVDHQLRHVLVVADASPDHGWFAEQFRVCQAHNVAAHIVVLPSRKTPTPEALMALIAALQQLDGPVLIEGRTGMNREAIAAAVEELLAGASPLEARRQFSWRYGYLHSYASKGPHVFLDDYQAWLDAGRRKHSPNEFARWVATTHDAAIASRAPQTNWR